MDLNLRADRHRTGAQTAVDLFIGVDNRLERAAADKGFHRYLGRHDADRIAALGDDRVDPDRVLFPESLALR
jgi:hypothetical protein